MSTAPLLNVRDICDRLRLSRKSVYAAINERGFPKPMKFGRASRWLATDVEGWIEARRVERDATHGQRSATA